MFWNGFAGLRKRRVMWIYAPVVDNGGARADEADGRSLLCRWLPRGGRWKGKTMSHAENNTGAAAETRETFYVFGAELSFIPSARGKARSEMFLLDF